MVIIIITILSIWLYIIITKKNVLNKDIFMLISQEYMKNKRVIHPCNSATHRELDFSSCEIIPILDCNYTFPIDLIPNGISFVAKSIRKVYLQSKFVSNLQDLKPSSLCVVRLLYVKSKTGKKKVFHE